MLDPAHPITKLLREDRRYRLEAYAFVCEALSYAQNVLEMGKQSPSEPPLGRPEEDEPAPHVSGQELCEAVRQFAIEQFGLMAKTVLNSWGVRSTADIGEIVFNLIRIGQMRKTPSDRREDFDDVYDFAEAFRQEFRMSQAE